MKFGSTALVAAILVCATTSFADDAMDGAYLDKPYKNLVHPVKSTRAQLHQLGSRSNTEAVIARQTPVRNQNAKHPRPANRITLTTSSPNARVR